MATIMRRHWRYVERQRRLSEGATMKTWESATITMTDDRRCEEADEGGTSRGDWRSSTLGDWRRERGDDIDGARVETKVYARKRIGSGNKLRREDDTGSRQSTSHRWWSMVTKRRRRESGAEEKDWGSVLDGAKGVKIVDFHDRDHLLMVRGMARREAAGSFAEKAMVELKKQSSAVCVFSCWIPIPIAVACAPRCGRKLRIYKCLRTIKGEGDRLVLVVANSVVTRGRHACSLGTFSNIEMPSRPCLDVGTPMLMSTGDGGRKANSSVAAAQSGCVLTAGHSSSDTRFFWWVEIDVPQGFRGGRMEQKHIVISALSVGLGIGVGLGLTSGQTVSRWAATQGSSSSGLSVENVEQELKRLIVDGKDSNATFNQFPYYLSPLCGNASDVYIAVWYAKERFVSNVNHSVNCASPIYGTAMDVYIVVCELTRVRLTSAAYFHLKQADFSKHTRNLSPASRSILLSGPAESYHQMLAKALAHCFDSKLLLLDVIEFTHRIQSKYGCATKPPKLQRSISETALERMSNLLGSLPIISQKEELKGTMRRQSSGVELNSSGSACPTNMPKFRRNSSVSTEMNCLGSHDSLAIPATLKQTTSWPFDEKLLVQSLYKVLVFYVVSAYCTRVLHSLSKSSPIILYIRDVDKLLFTSKRMYSLFENFLKRISGTVLILGSRKADDGSDNSVVDEEVTLLFPYNIEIKQPEDETHLVSWKSQLEEDMKMIKFQDNRNHIIEVLAANDIDCDDLGSICHADTMVLGKYVEEIVMSAVSYHLMNTKDPEYRSGKLVISSMSLSHALSIFQETKLDNQEKLKLEGNANTMKESAKGNPTTVRVFEAKTEPSPPESKTESEKSPVVKKDEVVSSLPPKAPEVAPDNEFEKRIRPEVIPANEIGVTFDDIGALDDTKNSLQELVMLPLRRPDLFKGGLLKPCRGILLFGPPGTGKTMLAKAIANEAGASFINVSMSTITSKWFGEDEKNVRALFTLAAKVSPTIIFVDEVDSMLGQRNRAGEHEAMRKIKNEFMTHWDGLMTKPGERILVLAATNRPFDLDEAIIRRFERRIMVGLPSLENRELILRKLLSKEKTSKDLDYKELATMTEGYSGSDLKTLCTTSAYRPVRELIQAERLKELEKKQKGIDNQEEACKENKDEALILRPLNMKDMRQAKDQALFTCSKFLFLLNDIVGNGLCRNKVPLTMVVVEVAASFAPEGSIMSELKQWNELYGDGGSRKKQQLTYFLRGNSWIFIKLEPPMGFEILESGKRMTGIGTRTGADCSSGTISSMDLLLRL
ncbi:hypothetical protein ZIOFF_000823 [Zingiber officinale]|uniref:AAA+ ATPase domain-containing protein n=1 Tax=Zingiber officinale TaxID=94328 RepID=A0A8J5I501_ZINOF|nr:hypothetical protein ZIOFF_000823 [Zingiber officinale]